MAGTLVGELIKQYETSSGAYTGVEEHLNKLVEIGEEFVAPNDISPEDLNNLARSLGNLLKLLRSQNVEDNDLNLVMTISANISGIATRALPERTFENNMYILSLGQQLVELRSQLITVFVPGILFTFIECLNKI